MRLSSSPWRPATAGPGSSRNNNGRACTVHVAGMAMRNDALMASCSQLPRRTLPQLSAQPSGDALLSSQRSTLHMTASTSGRYEAPVTAGRIERLKQLLNRKLSDDFVSTLRDQELEWLVAKGFNSVEAFQAATVGALHGVAPDRAGALCAAFAGTSPSRTAPAASEVYSNITWLWPNNATGEYSEARLKRVSREFFVRRIVAQPIFVVPVSSKPEQILYCDEGVAVYSMDVVPMADGAMLAVVPISRNSFFM